VKEGGIVLLHSARVRRNGILQLLGKVVQESLWSRTNDQLLPASHRSTETNGGQDYEISYDRIAGDRCE
jgi:hypothetical protein